MSFVKHKGTNAVKHIPKHLDGTSKAVTQQIINVTQEHTVPDSRIITWDQAGCHLVSGGDWTIEN
jgi:hypothetical protein